MGLQITRFLIDVKRAEDQPWLGPVFDGWNYEATCNSEEVGLATLEALAGNENVVAARLSEWRSHPGDSIAHRSAALTLDDRLRHGTVKRIIKQIESADRRGAPQPA